LEKREGDGGQKWERGDKGGMRRCRKRGVVLGVGVGGGARRSNEDDKGIENKMWRQRWA